MMDIGRKKAEKLLKELEKRIGTEYSNAGNKIEKKINKYLDDFTRKDAEKQKQLAQGMITKKQYNDWKVGQIITGNKWKLLSEEISQISVAASIASAGIIYECVIKVYGINRNYAQYIIDKALGAHVIAWTMYDKHTVERLLLKNPQLLPNPSKRVLANVAAGRAKLWERRQIQSVMLQGILQGESIPKIAQRTRRELGESYFIEEIKNKNKKTAKQVARELERKNRNAAIRNARTMTTSAENAGRMDCFMQAEDIGISLQKTWMATYDSRTRRSHAEMDGETVPIKEEFSNGLMYPADMDGAPEEVYNCRCTMVAEVDTESSNTETGQSVSGMSFDDWEEMMDEYAL